MPGHLEQAAGILNTAGRQTPVEQVRAAHEQLATVAQHIQAVGGQVGESLTHEAMGIHDELQAIAARLQEFRQRLESAAAAVMSGGP